MTNRGPAQPVLVMFALEHEAAPFRRIRSGQSVEIRVSGVGRGNARRAIATALQTLEPRLVVAAGFCGALVPALKIGDIVASPDILTVDHLVADPREKRLLAERHDASAVDMESDAIADVCAARNVPFTAIRAVSDTSDTALSPELVKLLSGGSISIGKVCLALLRTPSLLKEFRRLHRDTKIAAQRLADALALLLTAPDESIRSGPLPS